MKDYSHRWKPPNEIVLQTPTAKEMFVLIVTGEIPEPMEMSELACKLRSSTKLEIRVESPLYRGRVTDNGKIAVEVMYNSETPIANTFRWRFKRWCHGFIEKHLGEKL